MHQVANQLQKQLAALKVLIVDDEAAMRKVTRSLLYAIGVETICEAKSCSSGLEAICTWGPDVVIVDWQMPGASGAELVRQVRSPGSFPSPDVPIVMLTGHAERSRVVEAVRLGVNEFLVKPVSSKALMTRLVSILANPRRIVHKRDYYGPEPRKISDYKPDFDTELDAFVMVD